MIVLIALAGGCAPKAPPAAEIAVSTVQNPDAVAGVQSQALAALLDTHWQDTMERSPTWATRLGDHRWDDRIEATGPAAVADGRAARARFLEQASRIDATSLNATDRTTLELFVGELETSRRTEVCEGEQWSLSPRSNPLTVANEIGDLQAIDTPEKQVAYLARVRALPTLVAGERANLEAGIAAGRTPNAASVRLVIEQFDRELAKPVAEWQVAKPGVDAGGAFRDTLTAEIESGLRPALADFRAFLDRDLLPVARPEEKNGTLALPDGVACYEALIERHTSLPLTARELHDTGMAELERIHAEFRALGRRAFGTDELPAIFARLRSDPTLHFATAEQVEEKALACLRAAEAKVPAWFGRLPKAACEVRRVPDYEAPYTTIAYYMPPVPDGSRPGYYYVNVHAPDTRPRFEAAVLAYHESVPGHHFQIAIAQELGELPAFRRHLGTTAYVEGWALYTERLADEMGLYADDLDRMGMLSFDAWRASRLVVDTGVHAFGWSRARAEAFMLGNTPLAENNIRNEVDRYITWPGQALAYKTGQLRILALRGEAEAALGERFSLPRFHDVLLDGGALTLPVLERRVRAWIATGG